MKIQEGLKFKGTLTWTALKVPRWAIPLEKIGLYDIVKLVSKKILVSKYENIIVTAGKHSILDRMKGDSKGEITFVALGSNVAAPAVGDTQLGTEVYRKQITNRTRTGVIFYSSTYIPTGEGNGTHKEIGLFGDDATAAADSGTLFTHAVIDETKAAGISVTIDYNIEAL